MVVSSYDTMNTPLNSTTCIETWLLMFVKKKMKWKWFWATFVHIQATGSGQHHEDGEMNVMTLPYRHMTRNSIPGVLRPSTLPLGHGGLPHYVIFAIECKRSNFCFFKTWMQSGTQIRDLRLFRQAASATAPGPRQSESEFLQKNKDPGLTYRAICLRGREKLGPFQTEPEISRASYFDGTGRSPRELVLYDVIKSKHLKNVPSTETCM